MLQQPTYLPMSREEMDALGWDQLDVLLVSGDAYVDSHAFGAALLGRWLVANGYRAGIVAQPDWESTAAIERMGRPRLFAGVTAGALDSLIAHYTAFRKKRHDDAYTPGGRAGARPNRAVLVYTGLVRRAFPGLPVVIGGVEASLRRATHYDFWSDSLRRSILLDSKADLLLYGMAETTIVAAADLLADTDGGQNPAAAFAKAALPGSAYAVHPDHAPDGAVLPSHEAILAESGLLVKTALAFERQMLNRTPRLIQRSGGRTVVFEPPPAPLDQKTIDAVYALPFTRKAHPSYAEPIPAVEMLSASVASHRGCAGGCSFCSIALHQGRTVQSRSAESIVDEIARMAREPDWKGSISDVGGPSANMWNARCEGDAAACQRPSCLFPKRCSHFKAGQADQIGLLRKIARLDGVDHVRVASGVRHDLALESDEYIEALAGEFTGGQLKIAPEHVTENVLRLMRKRSKRGLEEFLKKFARASEAAGKEQYVIPYLMSAFPGCTDDDMRELGKWLDRRGFRPQQVQCFIPTPGTVASAMFYARVDVDGRPIHVARTDGERLFQHRLLLPDAEPPPAPPPRREERGRPGKPGGKFGKPGRPFGTARAGDRDRRGSDSRPPRRDGENKFPRSSEGERGRPRRPGGKFDKPGRSFGAERTGDRDRRGSDSRPPRRDGDNRFPRSSEDRGGKPARPGGKFDKPGRSFGAERTGDRDRRGSTSRPPRRDGENRTPGRPSEGGHGSRPRRHDGRPGGGGQRRPGGGDRRGGPRPGGGKR